MNSLGLLPCKHAMGSVTHGGWICDSYELGLSERSGVCSETYFSCALSCSMKFSRLLCASLRYRNGPTSSPSRILEYQRSCSVNILSLRSGAGVRELSLCRLSDIVRGHSLLIIFYYFQWVYPSHWTDEKRYLYWSPLAWGCSWLENGPRSVCRQATSS